VWRRSCLLSWGRAFSVLQDVFTPTAGVDGRGKNSIDERFVGRVFVGLDNFRDGDAGRLAMDEFDGISGGDVAFFDNAEINAGEAALPKAFDHGVKVEAEVEFGAGHAGLSDLQDGGADAVVVGNLDLGFEEARGCEVFAEVAGDDFTVQKGLPVGMVFGGVGIDGFVGAAVDGEVGLTVANEVVATDGNAAGDGRFEDRGENDAAWGFDFAGLAEVDGGYLHGELLWITGVNNRVNGDVLAGWRMAGMGKYFPSINRHGLIL